MFLVLIATCPSDLIVTLRGGPYNVITQLRDNPSCKSPLLGVHLRKGVIFWVPTHAPQPQISCPRSVPTFLSYHARGSPLGVGTSRVRLPLTGTRTVALKPPFSSLYYCSQVLRPLAESPPPRSFLPMGIGGRHRRCLNLATPHLGDVSPWRRLTLATPHLGNASPWRRLRLAMPHLGDASSERRLRLATPQVVNLLTSSPWAP